MSIITDANVLIDYCQSDLTILKLYATHVEPILIPSQVFGEVEQLTAGDCERHGLTIIDEPLDVLMRAAERRGPLSFPDRVCLHMALKDGVTCITNEKPLHKACREVHVEARWGLSLMVELVSVGRLDVQAAIDVAWKIHQSNPMYVHRRIVERFIGKLAAGDDR